MTRTREESRRPTEVSPETESVVLRQLEGLRDPERREECFHWLHRRYARRLLGFFAARISEREECRDLTQETFLRVLRANAKFQSIEKFESWLFTIAANVFRNHVRDLGAQKRDAPEVSLEGILEERGAVIPISPRLTRDPLQRLVDSERQVGVAKAMRELSPRQRTTLALRLFQEFEYQEIADVLGLSIGTVKAHLHQAKARLGTMVGAYFDREQGAER